MLAFGLGLSACGPLSSMPPPLPGGSPGDSSLDVGASLSAGPPEWVGLEGWMVWDQKMDFGLLAGVNIYTIPYGGGMIRIPFHETPTRFVGLQVTGGCCAWGTLGIPISVARGDNVWLFPILPSIGKGTTSRLDFQSGEPNC